MLVFEDLHWADPGLLDFVESLLEWSRDVAGVWCRLARPELSDRRPAWGVRRAQLVTLHLDRLADGDIETMVTGYVDGLPADGLARLVSRAEGVPMYAVETVRMLADRGVLEQTGGTYVVVGSSATSSTSLRRCMRWWRPGWTACPRPSARSCRTHPWPGRASPWPRSARSGGRTRCGRRTAAADFSCARRCSTRTSIRGRRSGGSTVSCSRCIQEVAYSTLSKAARRAKHLACAAWLEGLDEDELAGVVAQAYRAEPGAADADEFADRARLWLIKAADRASSLASPEQAYRFAVQALTSLCHPRIAPS